MIGRDCGVQRKKGTEEVRRGRKLRRKGEAMRKVAVIALVVMVSVALAASVMAQSAVRDECVALCKDAAKFINEKGLDAGIVEIGNKKGSSLRKTRTFFSWISMGTGLLHLIPDDASGKGALIPL